MAKILFIGVQELKEKSVIEQNADEKILKICIQEFQDLEIKRILGRSDYDRLSDELIKVMQNLRPGLSPADSLLMEYITPVMVYGALTYSISPLHYKVSNMGIKNELAVNSQSMDLAAVRANYSFKLDGYRADLKDYLNESSVTEKCCASPDDTTFNTTGMSLDDYTHDVEQSYENRFYGTHTRRY